MAAFSTIALVIGAAAAVGGAYTSYEAGKDQKDANEKAQRAAQAAQAEQAALAADEEKAAALKLKDQQARLVRGKQGRGGLLFGSELGVQDDDKASTLGG